MSTKPGQHLVSATIVVFDFDGEEYEHITETYYDPLELLAAMEAINGGFFAARKE